ncbi:MAG TPA: hypothetical protein VG713_02660 [Pirellulales bacterium]|nr:hypothetical protein [Pirellulales bacterium]
MHPTAQSYLREVGAGQQTAGSSYIELAGNSVYSRRIDLRADHPAGYRDALAHEMTHVVVAERFAERQIPRWADEGVAVLADSASKQRAHLYDLQQAYRRGTTFRLVELFAIQEYPPAERQATFYGQSVSLAKFLLERGTSEQFMLFVEVATNRGYDIAAREVYQLEGLGQLEQQWRAHVASPKPVATAATADPLLSKRSLLSAEQQVAFVKP